MTESFQQEFYESLCDVIATVETLADEAYEGNCFGTSECLDSISTMLTMALFKWQKEITN